MSEQAIENVLCFSMLLVIAAVSGCSKSYSAGNTNTPGPAHLFCRQLGNGTPSSWQCNAGLTEISWQASCSAGGSGNFPTAWWAKAGLAGTCPGGTSYPGQGVIQFDRK
jgi:hypothetical protein